MIQQVNLYQDQNTGTTSIILNPYLLALILPILCLMMISAVDMAKLYRNQAEQQRLQVQIQQSQAQLQLLQSQNPKQQLDSNLSQELQQTQSYYQNISRTLALLSDTQSDYFRGFSRYLLVLANQSDSHVWLTNIRFNSETNSIRLQGSTFKPEQIPLLLQRLQNTSAFKGRHFAKLDISQAKNAESQINFSVSSSLIPEPEVVNANQH